MKNINYANWNSYISNSRRLSTQEKGLSFEVLTFHILKTHPVYASKVKEVWLLRNGAPNDVNKKLNLPGTDEGIDIIAQTYSGEYWAIQCKFKSSMEPPTMRELSTFNNLAHTHCKNISMAILFHTGERGVRKKHLMGDKYSEVGLDFWLGLTSDDWKKINAASLGKKVRPQKRSPKDHQQKAIIQAYEHFIKNKEERGRLIMPCGTGKSLTAFWIANKLSAKSVIVAVPSLNLIKQSLEDWTAEFIAQNVYPLPEWQVVCSDKTTGKLEDDFVSDVYSLGIPTTTNVDEITSFLRKQSMSRKVIFTTYQSSDSLTAAAQKAKFSFDFAILDEAHKTVGVKSKSFASLLSDKNISIKKRMFMTATERVLKGQNDDVLSMDDESVYGKRFYQLTFKDAIHSNPQIISDYKILTIAVSNAQIQELIQKNKLLSDKKKKIEEQDAQSLAAAIALRQATKKYGIKHAISFHKSIKAAESFTNLNSRLNKSKFDKIVLTSYHISSKKSAGQRSQLLDDFKADELALMTNARCLTEGVNIPSIDCVLFADPKQSIVDIVQAAGRALRVSPGKKFGFIMMPLIVPDNMELNEFTETTPFKQVSRIVAALSTQDERIVEEFRLNDQGKRNFERRVEITGNIPIGLKLDISSFASSIEAKYWEKVGRANWRSFEEARQYVRSLGLKNQHEWKKLCKTENKPKDIPSSPNTIYKHEGWVSFGNWLGTDSVATRYLEFKDFISARDFVRNLGLKSQTQWKEYIKSGYKPNNIPATPDKIYHNKGWLNWGDFLGTRTIATFQRSYLSYNEAQTFVKNLNLKSFQEWRLYSKSGLKPENIPAKPMRTYRNKGWVSIGEWLGTNIVATNNREYLSLEKARLFVRKLKLKNIEEWKKFKDSSSFPNNIPKAPDIVYGKQDKWISWGDFLGTNFIATNDRNFKPYSVAKKYVHSLKLNSVLDWVKYIKSGKLPLDIPKAPALVYGKKGVWVSWGDWLGSNQIVTNNIKYISYSEARKILSTYKVYSRVRYQEFRKKYSKKYLLPAAPDRTYKKEGWISWNDFLGKK
jgi:superfamily II DNA or RNA helicase